MAPGQVAAGIESAHDHAKNALQPHQISGKIHLDEGVDLNPDGTSVALWDGHVELLSNEEFEAIIDAEQSVCLACEFGMNSWLKKREP